MLEQAVDRAAVRYDRAGDQHYDVASAFIKSMRGSDVDAALHYLARMLEAGEDPRFIARRVMIAASEDVGMADPSALVDRRERGAGGGPGRACPRPGSSWPRRWCTWPRRRSPTRSTPAVDEAIADVRAGLAGPVPVHLRDSGYAGAAALGHGQGYRYAHDDPRGVVEQQYAPDGVSGKDYYRPSERGAEREIAVPVWPGCGPCCAVAEPR